MKSINPYLNFNEETEEAFNFYKQVFGGDFSFIQRFKDTEDPEGNFAPDEKNKIMHIAFPMGNGLLMASDIPKKMKSKEKVSFNLSVETGSKEEADRIFKKLAKGGKINMPMKDEFWGAYFGMITDKFGVNWMISYAKASPYPTQENSMKGRNMEKMENEMKMMNSEIEEDLVVKRVFNAPIEKVWKAWTNPREIRKWWGPKDFTAPVIKADFRVAGTYLYCMRGSVAQDMPERDYCNVGEFLQIMPMKKIVTSVSFSDEQGNPVRASYYEMPGEWPMQIVYTVTFEELNDKTKLTIKGTGVPDDMKENAQMGWQQSFDKLENSIQSYMKAAR